MKTSTLATTLIALAASASAQPTATKRQTGGVTGSLDQTAIKSAVLAWQSDTGLVSNFLNVAAVPLDPNTLATDANLAFMEESDELNHKAVLDNQLCGNGVAGAAGDCDTSALDPQLATANNTLVGQGTFQNVVNLLQALSLNEINQAGGVNSINQGDNGIGGRCAAVLPAIDMYFAAAAGVLSSTFGDTSLNGVTAIRPAACST